MTTREHCRTCGGTGRMREVFTQVSVVCERCAGDGNLVVEDDDEANADEGELLWPESIRWNER